MIENRLEQIFTDAIPDIELAFGDDVSLDSCGIHEHDFDKSIHKVIARYSFKDNNLDREIIFNEYKAEFVLNFTVEDEDEIIEKVKSVDIPQYLIDWIKQQSVRKISYMHHYIHSNYGSFHNWNKRRKIKILKNNL